MSLTGAAIQMLADKGMSPHEIAAIAIANEPEAARSSAAKRQARYRERKRESVTGDVTGDVTPPLKDKLKTPSSEANASGGPAADPAKLMWDLGVEVLTGAGKTESQARSLIGKWRKATGKDGDVLTGLIECRARSISEPVEWLTKRFEPPGYVSASGYRYRGGDEAVMREAEKRADWGTYWKAKGNLDGERVRNG